MDSNSTVMHVQMMSVVDLKSGPLTNPEGVVVGKVQFGWKVFMVAVQYNGSYVHAENA